MSLPRHLLTMGQKSTPLKDKLDSAMARLDRLRLQDDGLWDESGHEERAKLFKSVFAINYSYHRAHFLLAL